MKKKRKTNVDFFSSFQESFFLKKKTQKARAAQQFLNVIRGKFDRGEPY